MELFILCFSASYYLSSKSADFNLYLTVAPKGTLMSPVPAFKKCMKSGFSAFHGFSGSRSWMYSYSFYSHFFSPPLLKFEMISVNSYLLLPTLASLKLTYLIVWEGSMMTTPAWILFPVWMQHLEQVDCLARLEVQRLLSTIAP